MAFWPVLHISSGSGLQFIDSWLRDVVYLNVEEEGGDQIDVVNPGFEFTSDGSLVEGKVQLLCEERDLVVREFAQEL